MTQLSRTRSLRPPRPFRREAATRAPVHVVVDWSVESERPGAVVSSRVELESASEHGSTRPARWICRTAAGASWEEALLAAGCPEVVLTAELGDDPEAKHLVFGLAEHLTHSLAANHPMVRIRFVPSNGREARPRFYEPTRQ